MRALDSLDAPLQPRPPGLPVPLTAVQLQLWNDMAKRGTRLSNMRSAAVSVRILGTLNEALLYQSIETVAHRHESLRTLVVSSDGQPRQQVDPHFRFRLDTIDLSSCSIDTDKEVTMIVHRFIDEKIDISIGPLFEGKLLRLPNNERVLILVLDHMFCDGVSNMILGREIWGLYRQGTLGCPSSLPPLPVQFADYAVWQHQTSDAWHKIHGPYWRDRLSGSPTLRVRCDEVFDDHALEIRQFTFGRKLTAKLRDAARHRVMPLSSVVLAIYLVAISRWLEQNDIVLGFLSHGRNRPELACMIGYIANKLYIRVSIKEEDSLLDLIDSINLQITRAYEHQDYGRVPGVYLQESPGLYFNWIPSHWIPIDSAQRSVQRRDIVEGELAIQPFPIQLTPVASDASFKLSITPSDTTAGIISAITYRSGLFSREGIENLSNYARSFSEIFAANPHTCIGSLAL